MTTNTFEITVGAFLCLKGVGRNTLNSLFLALRCLYSGELSITRCAPELRRNNIAIFGMAVACIINIFLSPLASIPDSIKAC